MNKKKYYIYELDIKWLNIISIFLLILAVGVPFLINPNFVIDASKYITKDFNFVIFMILYIFYMIAHEIFHSIAYVMMGANFKNVLYGAALEKGVLYCLCKQNVSKKNILVSLLTPFFFLGVITFILSFIFNSPYLLYLSIFNISGCSGDIMMFLFIMRLPKNIQYSEYDDPVSFGIYSDVDISSRKHFGLLYHDTKDSLERNDMKKITISKTSKIIFVVLIILLALLLFISLV